jgi:hypothetical protein
MILVEVLLHLFIAVPPHPVVVVLVVPIGVGEVVVCLEMAGSTKRIAPRLLLPPPGGVFR